MLGIGVDDLLTALALVLVLEGLALAAFPGALSRALEHLEAMPREALRLTGLLLLLLGVFFLYLLGR